MVTTMRQYHIAYYRLVMRPIGVVSKKLIGAYSTAYDYKKVTVRS